VRNYAFPLFVGVILIWIVGVTVWIALDPHHGAGP
jgi:hypothetical protein